METKSQQQKNQSFKILQERIQSESSASQEADWKLIHPDFTAELKAVQEYLTKANYQFLQGVVWEKASYKQAQNEFNHS